MDTEIPTDLITKSQITFRQLAGLSSFNPNHTPSSSTLQSLISTLDTSPPDTRCKYCDGKLIRELQSLICIYCGQFNKKEDGVNPETLLFKSTTGYGWLLQSLSFNGSERVGSFAEGIGINGAQSPAEDELTLSELLDLQIVWRDEPQKSESNFNIRGTSELDSSLTLGTDDVDNFFIESKRATVSDVPEEQPVASRSDQNKDFDGQENLTLFQNVLPPETFLTSSIDASDAASSGWNAEFQSADNIKMENETSKSVDPFVGAETDLPAHMDSVFGQIEGFNDKKPNDDLDPFTSTGKDWIQDDLFGQTGDFDNKNPNNDSDPFPSTGEDWIQDDLFANTSAATLKQAGQLHSVVQAHDISPDSKDVEEDWFGDGNWQKSSTANTAVSQQVDQLDVVGKQNDGSSHDNVNDSSTEGVNVDWFENTNWQKSTANTAVFEQDDKLDVVHQRNDGSSHDIVNDSSSDGADVDWFKNTSWQQSTANNTATVNDDNLFVIKPQIGSVSSRSLVNDLIQNNGSGLDNKKKQNSDATDWFQDSQWAIGASSSTTNVVTSKDDDMLDDWNDFTSSTVDQDSFPDSWKESSHTKVADSENMSELNLFPSTADAQEVDFGNFLQSGLFSGSSGNKNPTDTQEVFDIFSEVFTTSRIPNAEAGNSTKGPKNDEITQNPTTSQKNDVQMLLSQMHDLSFMLKSELSIPSKPDDSDSSHS